MGPYWKVKLEQADKKIELLQNKYKHINKININWSKIKYKKYVYFNSARCEVKISRFCLV